MGKIKYNNYLSFFREIRAFTVLAVERLKEEVRKRGQKMNSVEIDWFLWQTGEKVKDNIKNHHRTLTIYY